MNSLLCILKRCKYHVCQSSLFPAENNCDGVSERAMQGHKLDFVIVVELQAGATTRDIYVFDPSGDYLDLKDTKVIVYKAEKAEANKNK